MKRGILAIFDYEAEYVNQLMDFLNRKAEFILEARAFTKLESLYEFIKEQKVEILLVTEDAEIETAKDKVKHIIRICEGKYIKEVESDPVIYKFQSAENIMRELLAYYVANNGNEVQYRFTPSSQNCSVVGVFSPSGGSRKTTFSLALGQALGTRKKVLYFNLELFSAEYQKFSDELVQGLSELIYYTRQKKSNFSIKLQSIIQKIGNIDYIVPVHHYSDLFELQEEDIYELIECLQSETNYDVVIFDVSFISEAIFGLFHACDKIYMPTSSNPFHKQKEKAWFRLLEMEEREELIDKFIPIEVPYDNFFDKGEYQIENLCIGNLGNYIHVLLSKEECEY